MGAPTESLLERNADLAAIRGLLREAGAGNGRVSVVEGPAGIGKTALLAAASAVARDEGFQVLHARGGELEREFAFGLARQLFGPALGRLSSADRDEVMSGAAVHAERVLDLSIDDRDDTDGFHASLHGLYWLCANVAERSPLLLAVDDAHWADAASLRWLNYLARRLDGVAVAVLVATRPGAPEAAAPLLDDLRRDGDGRLLALAPLSEDGVRGLVEGTFGCAADDEFVHACHEQSGGNPLLARELAKALAADGARPDASAAHRVLAIPPRDALRAVLLRLGRLPPAASALARAVSVLETDVRLGDAAALAGLDDRAASDAADGLLAAGLLVADPGLRFAHPLLRAAVYEDIPPARRARDHARAAELLRGDRAMGERVTAHLLACEPTGESWVIEHLRAAARDALARGAPETAIVVLERALAERPGREVRAGVLYELGMAERRFAPWAAVPLLSEAHDATSDARERIAIARDLAVALMLSARPREAFDLLERKLREIPDDDRELALATEAELLAIGMTAPGMAEWVDEHIARLPPLDGVTPGERLVLANIARRQEMIGESVEDAADMAERAAANGQLLSDQSPDSGIYALTLIPIVVAGRYDVAERLCDHALADATRRGSLVGLSQAGAVLAFSAVWRGELLSAQAQAQTALECAREARFLPSLTSAVRVLVEVAIDRGELDAADALLVDNHLAGDLPDIFVFFNFVLHARGCLRLAQGRTDEGIRDLLEVGERDRAAGHGLPTPWRSFVAPALAARGEMDVARQLVAEDLAIARRRAAPGLLARTLRGAAQVEGGTDAIAYLREAVRLLEPTAMRLQHAHARADLGAALRRANQRAEARGHLRQALDIGHRCGATVLAQRVREELLATGARPRKNVISGVDALTASERRVAELAAQGMTNKQIAQALFVTHRTVATHLAHTYAKLDIADRRQLAAKLSEPADVGAPRAAHAAQ